MSEDASKRPQKLSRLDKAAVFLLSLGESDAAAILKHNEAPGRRGLEA